MTDTRLYLAIRIPSGLFALNFLAILWQARGLERSFNARIDGMERFLATRLDTLDRIMDARFEAAQQALLRVEGILDARLTHLEDRERR